MIVAEEAVLTQELFWLLWKHDFFKSFYWFALKQTFFWGGRGGGGGSCHDIGSVFIVPYHAKISQKIP